MLIPYAAATTVSALKGLGRHAQDLTLDQFFEVTRIEIIGQTWVLFESSHSRSPLKLTTCLSFGIIGVATSKASVSVFLLRITIIRWHRWVLYIVILCVSTSCFFCALFDYIRCDPVSHIWNPTIPARCWMTIDQFTSLSLAVGGTYYYKFAHSYLTGNSYLGNCWLRARDTTVAHSLGSADEKERQNIHCFFNESGAFVSHLAHLFSSRLTKQCWSLWCHPNLLPRSNNGRRWLLL